jgi:hypothetical protein
MDAPSVDAAAVIPSRAAMITASTSAVPSTASAIPAATPAVTATTSTVTAAAAAAAAARQLDIRCEICSADAVGTRGARTSKATISDNDGGR